jgi:hypothetical protein
LISSPHQSVRLIDQGSIEVKHLSKPGKGELLEAISNATLASIQSNATVKLLLKRWNKAMNLLGDGQSEQRANP